MLRTTKARRNCAGRKKGSKDAVKDAAGAATSARQNGASGAALPADLTTALPPEQSRLSAEAQPFLPDSAAGAGASAPVLAADHVRGSAALPADGSEAAGAGSEGCSEPGGAAQAEAAPRASDAPPAAQLLARSAPASAFEAPASSGISQKEDPGSAGAALAPDSRAPGASATASHGSLDKEGVSAGGSDSLAAPLLPAGARDPSDRAGAGAGGGDDKRAPWAATVAALLSLSLGWGLWLMPADFARLGWLPAVGVTIFLAVSTMYSGFLISRLCRAVPNAVIFGDIGEAALGRRGRALSYTTIYATDATRCIILHLAATQALQAAVAREDVPLLVYALVIAGLALICVQVPCPYPYPNPTLTRSP